MGRLTDEIGDLAEARREFVLIVRQTRTILDHAGHRTPIERQRLILVRDRADKQRVRSLGLRRAIHLRGEIGLDLEEFLKVLVIGVEQVVDDRVADENHFHVQRRRLRIERDRADQLNCAPNSSMRTARSFNARFKPSHANGLSRHSRAGRMR